MKLCKSVKLKLIFSVFFRSFFQSVCVLGYCLTPLAVSLIVCRAILVVNQTNFTFFLRLVTSTGGFAWATYGEKSKNSRRDCKINLNFFQPQSSSWATANRQTEKLSPFIQFSSSTLSSRGSSCRTRTNSTLSPFMSVNIGSPLSCFYFIGKKSIVICESL